MIRKCSFLCLFFLSWSLDLENALLLAKQNDPGYKSKVLELQAALYSDKIAIAGFAPQIDFSIIGTQSTTDHVTSTNSHNFKMTIGMDIYNPEQIVAFSRGKLDTQEAFEKLKKLSIDHNMQTILLYFDTLKAHSNLRVKHFALQQYQKSYQEALEKQESGLVSAQETLAYKSSLDAASLAVSIANNELHHNVNTLKSQLNAPIEHLHIHDSEEIPTLNLPPQSETIEKALCHGERIKLAIIKLKKARNSIASSETAFIPKASVSLSQSQPVDKFITHFLDTKTSSAQSTQLSLSVNVFSGFSDLNTLRKKKMEYLSAESFLADEQYEVRLSIEKAYRDYENNLLQAKAALSSMKSAEASLKATAEKHALGNVSELEYANAITIASDAKASFQKSIYTLMSCYLNIKALSSTLTQETISEINPLLDTEISLLQSPDPSYPTYSEAKV